LEDIFAHAVTNTVGQPETGGESSNPFVGTWTGDDGTVTITGSTWEMTGDVKGTYTRNGNRATLATTHYWSYYGWEPITGIPQYTATVSGNTLTVLYDGETLRFTRETGGGSANPFVGTWTGDGGALTIANSTWELAEDVKGTYTRRGNGATLATTHYWSLNRWVSITGEPLHTANVSGTTLVVNYYDETLMFTKKSGVSGSF
jgi:hypothetical protein